MRMTIRVMTGFSLVEQLIAALVAALLLGGLARIYLALALTGELQWQRQQLEWLMLSQLEGNAPLAQSLSQQIEGRWLDGNGRWRTTAVEEASMLVVAVQGSVDTRSGPLISRYQRWLPQQPAPLMLVARQLGTPGSTPSPNRHHPEG